MHQKQVYLPIFLLSVPRRIKPGQEPLAELDDHVLTHAKQEQHAPRWPIQESVCCQIRKATA